MNNVCIIWLSLFVWSYYSYMIFVYCDAYFKWIQLYFLFYVYKTVQVTRFTSCAREGRGSVFWILLVIISFIRFVKSDQTTCFETILTILVFSSPELWARELFCLPVVRLDLSLRPSENFSHFRFSKSILG